jgi:leader peptidase (prepilin peptidase)/N-methyltransferase
MESLGPLGARMSILLLAAIASSCPLSIVDALFAICLAALTGWLILSDLTRFHLPDPANLAVAGLGATWVALQTEALAGLADGALRALVVAALLIALKAGYARLRGFEGLGWGDVKLAAAGAVWLQWEQLPIALFVAATAGILAVVLHATLVRTTVSGSAAIPFGAFLAPSISGVWLAGRLCLW